MEIQATYVGTACVLWEVGELRLLSDPVFDPAGGRYGFGWGTASRKLSGPAMTPEAVGRIDAVLLSHEGHADNLDREGRALLPRAGRVLTTPAGARRLGGNALGLAPWQSVELARGATRLTVTGTPARHGPPGSLPLVGAVTGFSLASADRLDRPYLYVSGDTVRFAGTAEVARRLKPRVAALHLGGARFAISGPVRYTLTSEAGAAWALELDPEIVVPLHFDGWSHFAEGRAASEAAFGRAGLGGRVRWLEPGVRTWVGSGAQPIGR